MKKLMMIGMVIISTTSASNLAFAANPTVGPGAAGTRSPRDVMRDYVETSKKAILGASGTTRGMSDARLAQARRDILADLALPHLNAGLTLALAGNTPAARARMETLITLSAAKKTGVELAKVNKAEGDSIVAAADAAAKYMTNLSLIGSREVTTMSAVELTTVRSALTKMENISGEMVVNYSKAERDSHTKILEVLDQKASTGRLTIEEAMIQTVMEVKGVDRAKALEIIGKLSTCV